MSKTALEIIKNHLTEIGADGLCTPDVGCGCGLHDLAPCGNWIGGCVPARAVTSGIGPDGGAWTDDEPWFEPMEENQ